MNQYEWEIYLKYVRDTGANGWSMVQTIEDPHNRLCGKALTAVVQTRFPQAITAASLSRKSARITMQRVGAFSDRLVFQGQGFNMVEDGAVEEPISLTVGFTGGTEMNFSVDRVVLMEGAHTELPPRPDPAVNLARCMRYYQRIEYQTVHWYAPYALTGFLLPAPMRKAPTLQGCKVTTLEAPDVALDARQVHVTPERVYFFEMGPAFATAGTPRGYYASVNLFADYAAYDGL